MYSEPQLADALQDAIDAAIQRALSSSPPPRFLSTKQAASYLGVSRQLLEALRQSGEGPRYTKLQRIVRYAIDDLDQWMSSQRVDSGVASDA